MPRPQDKRHHLGDTGVYISTVDFCSPWRPLILPAGPGLARGCCSTPPRPGRAVWTSRWSGAWRSHSLRKTAPPWSRSWMCGPSPTPPQTAVCPTGDRALSWRNEHKNSKSSGRASSLCKQHNRAQINYRFFWAFFFQLPDIFKVSEAFSWYLKSTERHR